MNIKKQYLNFYVSVKRNVKKHQNIFNEILERAINVINRIYFVEVENIYVNASKYHKNIWGPLYWSLLHTMSILILHAFETKNINDFIRFSNNCISY